MSKTRILGLDYGKSRIGVAVSDELGYTAHPLTTITTGNQTQAIESILALAEEYKVSTIIIGLPIRMDGTDSNQTLAVRQFIEALKAELWKNKIDVIPWDERLSSAEAEQFLLSAGQSRQKRKKAIDKIAAALILQSYLWNQDAS